MLNREEMMAAVERASARVAREVRGHVTYERYRFRAGEEVLFGKGAAFVVVLEQLPRAENGDPRYLVQFENETCQEVREWALESA